ncbi:UNVERIFIED_CONTAM: hypothetical protein FKN15_019293 [Acipenser sinensis]
MGTGAGQQPSPVRRSQKAGGGWKEEVNSGTQQGRSGLRVYWYKVDSHLCQQSGVMRASPLCSAKERTSILT